MSNSRPDRPHIEVTGKAKISLEPDYARIKAELKVVGDDPSAAKREVDSQSAAVMQLARDCDVAEADVTATKLEIGPEYDWRSEVNKYKGTMVRREVSIVLRDLDQFSRLLQGLAEVPVWQLSDITMDTERREEVQRQALAQAITNAQRVAEDIASGLNQKITGVCQAVHYDRSDEDVIYEFAESPASEGSFSVGMIEVSGSVEIKFAIEPN